MKTFVLVLSVTLLVALFINDGEAWRRRRAGIKRNELEEKMGTDVEEEAIREVM